MKGYGQFCPIAKASEVLGERWTNLIIRELGNGSDSFNDLRKGLPLISPSLLSTRLKSLERAGIVQRQESAQHVSYRLTRSGRELFPIILKLGEWGHRWVRSDMSQDDLDPSLLMWDIHRNIDLEYFNDLPPGQRQVVLFEFTDYQTRYHRWWLVITPGEVDVCLKDPGYDVALRIVTDTRTLAHYWMGDISMSQIKREQRIQLDGKARLKKDITSWLGRSYFSNVKPARHK
ncbi:MAG: helix-turn-helix domain-containing protein [Pseudomonadota bacterium]|nr:helix-turn-helix domain-containing protein [Pseudomonadota bacterium]